MVSCTALSTALWTNCSSRVSERSSDGGGTLSEWEFATGLFGAGALGVGSRCSSLSIEVVASVSVPCLTILPETLALLSFGIGLEDRMRVKIEI